MEEENNNDTSRNKRLDPEKIKALVAQIQEALSNYESEKDKNKTKTDNYVMIVIVTNYAISLFGLLSNQFPVLGPIGGICSGALATITLLVRTMYPWLKYQANEDAYSKSKFLLDDYKTGMGIFARKNKNEAAYILGEEFIKIRNNTQNTLAKAFSNSIDNFINETGAK